MLRFFGKTLLAGVVLVVIVTGFSQSAGAAGGISWEVVAGYDYYHIRNDLSPAYREQLDANNRMIDLTLGFVTGNNNGRFSFGWDGKGDAANFGTNLKEFAWSGKANKILYEIGKTKWVWGRGLSFSPTCPLDMDTFYWGGQLSLLNLNNSLTIGAAANEDSYDSDISAPLIISEPGSEDYYTGWLRWGRVFETSDLTAVVSYQSIQSRWNYGLDFSRDLQNGFELHGGVNLNSIDSAVKYLIGGEYIGKYFYIAEFYHDTDDVLILAVNNSAGMVGNWQWEWREIYSLTDDGEIHKLNLSYLKNDHIVPRVEISMNAGPKSGKYRQNPFDYYVLFKATTKF